MQQLPGPIGFTLSNILPQIQKEFEDQLSVPEIISHICKDLVTAGFYSNQAGATP